MGPIIVVFGITGDLSRRKLLPALYNLLAQSHLPADTSIIGLSRKPLTVAKLLGATGLQVMGQNWIVNPISMAKLRKCLQTLQVDPTKQKDYQKLSKLINKLDPLGTRERLFYMSVPANAYKQVIKQMAANGLNTKNTRLLVEKPVGHSYASAKSLLKLTAEAFSEDQIYRIDHYLAKETAQNLLAFRVHNPIFAPIWNAKHIKSIHIKASEEIGIEGRANFYEQTGALRDLVQSHLLQLLALTMMDVPHSLTSESIHESKQAFLKKLKAGDPKETIRAQYKGYKNEVENPESNTETYVLTRLHHRSARWSNTQIILETGKALKEKTTEITLCFKLPYQARDNKLTLHLQPNEGISLSLLVKEPGLKNVMQPAALGFRYSEVFPDKPQVDAYERVFMDTVRGDQALFASDIEVLETWRVLQPILNSWKAQGSHGLKYYKKGSDGPEKTSVL